MALSPSYRVLARKYRPQSFSEMIGQDSLVRVLSNGIESGRLPHAFIFTGIRGVGKTTTARIMARSLNCETGPTVNPCGICEPCKSILEDRSVDVIEMDAASQTGVDDIRQIIDSVAYRPVLTRYKVYIIDEVHMLSKNAFNALLKTLEEPPAHVKFIFATTEIRKVPPTVLSRCMRLDLRRMTDQDLVDYFGKLLAQESIEIDPIGLRMIARFSGGSVRDGLSMVEQAISLGGTPISAAQIQDMLGLKDRAKVYDVWKSMMTGAIQEALTLTQDLTLLGMDPEMLLQELLEITHGVSCLKVSPEYGRAQFLELTSLEEIQILESKLSLGTLTQVWQILMNGLKEVVGAPSALRSLEMVLIRACYSCTLPPLSQVMDSLSSENHSVSSPQAPQTPPQALQSEESAPATLQDFIGWVGSKREPMMAAHLSHDVVIKSYEPYKIALALSPKAPKTFGADLKKFLGPKWSIDLVAFEPGSETLADQKAKDQAKAQEDVLNSPMVQGILDQFPGTIIN